MKTLPSPRPPSDATPLPPKTRRFDGVICFGGEDWWYHNRGHYDMQMMRELSEVVPVLYVNSIGMRLPRVGEGAMFLRRVVRKLRSYRRGLVRVRDRFGVFSPVAFPGRIGAAVTPRILPAQVRRAARRMGITRPLVWVACPPAVQAVAALDPMAVVYQRTDRFESFLGVDAEQIGGFDRRLRARADLTLFCSSLLYAEEAASCNAARFVDHGVDYDRFADAGQDPGSSEPADIAGLPRPRVGFIGGIDSHTFDPALFVEVATSLPDVRFILVGACSLPEGWCPLSNVTLLGQRPYEQVAGYMAACDVLIMPWNSSPWIQACNPVKLKEYLAVGRPVVTTGFKELERYQGFVTVAGTPGEFVGAIRSALAHGRDPARLRARVRDETWHAKGKAVLAELAKLGVVPGLS